MQIYGDILIIHTILEFIIDTVTNVVDVKYLARSERTLKGCSKKSKLGENLYLREKNKRRQERGIMRSFTRNPF